MLEGLKEMIIRDLHKLLMQVNLCTISLSLQPMDLLVEAPTSGTTNQHVIGRAFLKEFKIFIKALHNHHMEYFWQKRFHSHADSMSTEKYSQFQRL